MPKNSIKKSNKKQERYVKAYSLAAMLNIRAINGRFRLSLHLCPLFSDKLTTNYQPHPVAGEHLKEIRELLIPDRAGAPRATRMPGSTKDEIGRHFKIDLGPVYPMD